MGHVISFGVLISVKLIQRYLLRASIYPDEQKGQLSRDSNIFLVGIVLHYWFQAPDLARTRLPWIFTFEKPQKSLLRRRDSGQNVPMTFKIDLYSNVEKLSSKPGVGQQSSLYYGIKCPHNCFEYSYMAKPVLTEDPILKILALLTLGRIDSVGTQAKYWLRDIINSIHCWNKRVFLSERASILVSIMYETYNS